jgi:hypothetical protein
MLYLLAIEEWLIVERQFSGGSRADSLDLCISGEDIDAILAVVVNSELSQNVQFTEWSRSCRMSSALRWITVHGHRLSVSVQRTRRVAVFEVRR